MEMIPVFSNTLGEAELRAVSKVLASKWLGRGSECAAFEEEFADYCRTDHVLVTNCCTSAIHIGLRALGLEEGDEIIVSTVNFVACASAALELGMSVRFADVDPRTLNVLPEEIDRLRNDRTKAVLLLHYGGHPCPMDEVRRASEGLYVIEDAANAVSSVYKDKACGILGDMGVWSFDAMKMLVMADGGALWLRRAEHRRHAEALRYLGLPAKSPSGMDSAGKRRTRWWEYQVEAPSGRFISNDVLAAMGRVQLGRLPGFIARRKEIWRRYQDALFGVVITPPEPLPDCASSYYLYWIQTERRDELAAFLYRKGVYTTFRYYPLHLVEYFHSGESLPNAALAARTTLNLPLHQNLTDAEVDFIVELVRDFFAHPAD